ncbi:MAG: hypothetical protein MK212_11960 [Saprospiraceae bacterium]|nr:hypothetical protein [Saprospiraceae bacterium]
MRIDDFGTIYNNEDEPIGYYEPSTKQCFNLEDQPINCPSSDSIPKDIIPTPTINAKRTYWIPIVMISILIGTAIFLWRIGKKKA